MSCAHCYSLYSHITNVSLQVKCASTEATVTAFSQIDKGSISLDTDLTAPYPYTAKSVYTLRINHYQ